MSSDISIKVENLTKCYQIYDQPRDRLKQFIVPRLQGVIGQPTRQYFREFWALKDVSFEVKRGETVGIIGRNGSGKSTLLQMICGTLNPTSGSVLTQGRIAALLELGSGFNPDFTGRENVYMNGAVLGLSSEEIDQRFDAIATFADIGEFIEQPVKTYSSGMYVRLAFAVNIVSQPEIMIVDEALAVGDMNFQAKCMTALSRIQDAGATVLFVSHDIGSLKSLCSKGIYLEKGAIKSIGAAGLVADDYVREMREEMNTYVAIDAPLQEEKKRDLLSTTANEAVTYEKFISSQEFSDRVAQFRYGDGGARVTWAAILNEQLAELSSVDFDQTVLIRAYFESEIDSEVSCHYYVMDDKRNVILGADPLLMDKPLLKVKRGGKYIVTYKTRLPVEAGNYSIQFQITKAAQINVSAVFLDVVDNSVVFRVNQRNKYRLWAKVYVENELEVVVCV
jgi:lipopolysaccharide transport system ATP-binding protein